MHKYLEIINLSHYEPKNHPRMTIENRSAQFAPFSALTGYKEAIIESSRITDDEKDLDENEKEIINEKLQFIQNHLKEKREVVITYFIKDIKKSGGHYLKKQGIIQKIILNNDSIIMEDNTKIPINNIINIDF